MARKPETKALSRQQRAFADAFVRTGNATKSAREAGYQNPGDSGWKLRRLPEYKHVQDYISAACADHLAMIKREVPDSLRLLMRSRDFDPGRLKDESGKFKSWDELDEECRQCITEYSEKEYEGGFSVRIKWKNGDLAAAKIIEWALKHSDNSPKVSEAEIDADLKERMSKLREQFFPDESAPDIAPDKTEPEE